MTPAAGAWALELRDVWLRLGRTDIIRGLNLAVRAGERVALIGPNGAGKSSLFKLISGELAPSSGLILLKGQRIDGKPPHQINRLGLGRSFQISSLFPRLSVYENLRCGLLWRLGYRYRFWRWLTTGDAAHARTEALLAQLQLQHKRDTPAIALSYAEQRALELGITLAGGGDVILLDEPTAGMSQAETRHVIALIRTLTAGKTLITVEHDMRVVFDLADRIAVLVDGELLAFDTPAVVRADARVQQAYLGTLAGGTAC